MQRLVESAFDADLAGLGFQYVHLPFAHAKPKEADVVAFLKVVENAANQPVFVHCQAGVDRTGMMTAAYRIVVEGWTKEDAVREMRATGFHPWHLDIPRYLENLNVPAMKRALRQAAPPVVTIIP